MTTAPVSQTEPDYAIKLADDSYRWYERASIRSRKAYKLSETITLLIAATVPASAVITPDNATVPAILGTTVVVLTGLRSVFHWQDNYLRFSQAREAVNAERRLYHIRAEPYDNSSTRDQNLVRNISRIEQEEMGTWITIATPRPKVSE
jgi:Protein of unknown function (DUF4231)